MRCRQLLMYEGGKKASINVLRMDASLYHVHFQKMYGNYYAI